MTVAHRVHMTFVTPFGESKFNKIITNYFNLLQIIAPLGSMENQETIYTFLDTKTKANTDATLMEYISLTQQRLLVRNHCTSKSS